MGQGLNAFALWDIAHNLSVDVAPANDPLFYGALDGTLTLWDI